MLGGGDEVIDLQQTVLKACNRFRGKNDLKTLNMNQWQ